MKWENGPFTLSDANEDVDLQAVCAMLQETYWAANRPVEVIRKSIETSLCFTLLFENRQVGFARVVTDHATNAIILDVIVHRDFRGQGLGKWLIQCITEHPALASIHLTLWTTDADDLYRKCGIAGFSKVKVMGRNPGPNRPPGSTYGTDLT